MAIVKKHNSNRSADPGLTPQIQTQGLYPKTGGYEIRVKDHLETYWYEWFEGWSITNLEDGEVLLKNDRVDQSGLHGALNKIRDLNLTLISVMRVSTTGQL